MKYMGIMRQQEGLKIHGKWKLTAKHIKTGEVITREGENLIVTVGKALVGDILKDTAGYDTGLTYQAIGSSDDAVGAGDTGLTVEEARKSITHKSRAANVVTYSTFFTATESTYNIKEAGIFGHLTASGDADSGILFSHWLVAFDNSGGTYDITVDYVLTIG